VNWRRVLIAAEIVLVIGVIGRVAIMAQQKLDGARYFAARTKVLEFRDAVLRHKAATGTFPPTETGLSAIAPDPPTDPWGRKYHYKYPGSHGGDPDIWSDGADGRSPIGSWAK
jgi:general secretion pathway protein G